MKKVAFLFTRPRKGRSISQNHFYGMYGLRAHGFQTEFLELEQFLPEWLCAWLRKYVLKMHFAHVPLFPLFFKYDIIFSSTAYGPLILKALLGIKRFKWVLLDFNIIGTIAGAKTFRQKIFKWAVGHVDAIITISEAEKVGLEKMYPHLAGRITFIHEATDLDLFTPVPNIQEENFILAVGTYGRDFKTLVEAVRGTALKLIIATKPSLIKPLEPLPENVSSKLFTPAEMKELYGKAALVVVPLNPDPTSFDSVGTLSVGEGMAMRKTVVVSETLNMHSYVIDGENAVFVKPLDVLGMRTALQKLIDSPSLRKQIGDRAYTYAHTHLSEDAFAKNLSIALVKL